MELVHIIIVLSIVGFLLWLVNNYIPMIAPIKTIINLVVIILVVFWLLQSLGVIGNLHIVSLK